MPYSVSIFPHHRLGVISLENAVDGRTLIKAIETVFQQDDWNRGYNTLWDGRGIGALDIDASDTESIRKARQHLKSEMGPGLSVFLVARELDFMLARLFEITNRSLDREIKTTFSADDAANWLDVPKNVLN